MKKRIIVSIIISLFLCIVLSLISNIVVAKEETVEKNYTKEEIVELIKKEATIKQKSHSMAQDARYLGWQEDDELLKQLQDIWTKADQQEQKYQQKLAEIYAAEQKALEEKKKQVAIKNNAEHQQEYPAATYIWNYMKSLGWNDYICAGIMGNLMAEVGGQTLNIRYTATSSGYYGMCQWNQAYSKVWGADLTGQCDFLRDTIKYEFDTYGFKYQKGFNFNSFLSMTDARQAALAFAKCYERCGSGSYQVRQNNAIKAYNYFVN